MRCTISQFYFDKELYMFRTDLLSIISNVNTAYTAIDICHASYVDCLLADGQQTPDDGKEICPKHVEYFIKINLRNSASRWLYYKNIS